MIRHLLTFSLPKNIQGQLDDFYFRIVEEHGDILKGTIPPHIPIAPPFTLKDTSQLSEILQGISDCILQKPAANSLICEPEHSSDRVIRMGLLIARSLGITGANIVNYLTSTEVGGFKGFPLEHSWHITLAQLKEPSVEMCELITETANAPEQSWSVIFVIEDIILWEKQPTESWKQVCVLSASTGNITTELQVAHL